MEPGQELDEGQPEDVKEIALDVAEKTGTFGLDQVAADRMADVVPGPVDIVDDKTGT